MMKYLLVIMLFIVSCAQFENIRKASVQKKETVAPVSTAPLSERGWHDRDVRKTYIDNLGKGFYTDDITVAFIEGRVTYDMLRKMVTLIHGKPNVNKGDTWIYLDKNGNPLLTLKFDKTKVIDITYSY